ncbi:MAG: GGDEF domain-containing protein [Leptolyngbyaceae cyanobacterium MO_188.B28]|nr:GGDEF domain-containing protein [Leptolyngbyaceae cyanobacterium MO_188.B28]
MKVKKYDQLYFDRQLQAAYQRLESLQKGVYCASPASTTDLLTAALEDLSLILEELTVVTEELHQKNGELIAAHQTLAAERKRYQELFEFAPDSYLVTDPNGVIQEANQPAASLLQVKQQFLVGKPLTVFVAPAERKPFLAQLNQLAQWRSLQDWEMCLQPRGSEPLPVAIALSAITNPQDEVIGWRWLIRNIADRKLLEEKLYHDACYDSLTNLPNRRFFLNRLEHALKERQRSPERLFALLFLDLDRFKVINDSLGHRAGDLILIETARRLTQSLREVDIVARLGGDEFVILLDDLHTRHEAADCANRIQQVLAVPISVEDHDVVINGSIGVVLSDSLPPDAEALLRGADIAMYRAKQKGRACFELFQAQMQTQAMQALQLEQDLRQAIQEYHLRVYYQAIVSLTDEQVTGFEALVRWRHPQQGLLLPGEFLAVAEETGLIVPMGTLVLQAACRQLVQLQLDWAQRAQTLQNSAHPSKPNPLTLSVNLSNRQFSQPNLATQVADVLQETGFDPNCLKLEITEEVMMSNVQRATTVLEELKELQVKLEIDDFGIGFSSLSRLSHFPIDTLKIDRSFIHRMECDAGNLEIVRAIITLAHNLDMEVIAEGVEKAEQVEMLRSLNCDYAQGNYYSPPLSHDLLGSFWLERSLQR